MARSAQSPWCLAQGPPRSHEGHTFHLWKGGAANALADMLGFYMIATFYFFFLINTYLWPHYSRRLFSPTEDRCHRGKFRLGRCHARH